MGNLEFLHKEIHHESVGLMENEIVHVVDSFTCLAKQQLDALGHLTDSEIEDIHAVHEHLEVRADITLFLLALDTGLRCDGIAHAGVDFEFVLATAIGIEQEC